MINRYERLSTGFTEKVLTPLWARHAHDIKQKYGYDLAEQGLELRHRCQTDGVFLARLVSYSAGSAPDNERSRDFFVRKDPSDSPEAKAAEETFRTEMRHFLKDAPKNCLLRILFPEYAELRQTI